jgi:hypothetical protein
MRDLHFRELSLTSVTLLMAAGMTACSSGGGSTGSSPPPVVSSAPATSAPASAPPSGEPASGAGAIAAIKTNWVAFFDAKTPVAKRISLLQNGTLFASLIRAQASSPLALLATAKVSKVTLTGTSQAAVTYDILAGGQVGLSNQAGVAVYQDGTWKVGLASFCGLLRLENGGSSDKLPASCHQ